MSTISRTIRNVIKAGPASAFKQMNNIHDTKWGILVGTDRNGNKFFENNDEISGSFHDWFRRTTNSILKLCFCILNQVVNVGLNSLAATLTVQILTLLGKYFTIPSTDTNNNNKLNRECWYGRYW